MRALDRRWAATAAWIVLIALLLLVGCGKKDSGGVEPNIPPETHLTYAPDDGDTVAYRVRMNWFGWDPDGEVTHFLARWDSLEWFATVATGSTFVVETRRDRPDSLQDYRPHTFEIKAVDNDGAEDPTPESVTFTAFNVFPDTEVTGPTVFADAFYEFEWLGTDSDGTVVAYGYRLSASSGSGWTEITAEDSLGADETSAVFGPLGGALALWCRFEVWAIDDQGAVDQTPATSDFATECVGDPRLRVRSNIAPPMNFHGPGWDEWPPVGTVSVLSGDRLVFGWDASSGLVGYRHAYDDTSSWPAWSIDDTHFDVEPEPGEHALYVCGQDPTGRIVRGRIRFEAVEADLDSYILIVDDYDWFEFHPDWGSDAERSEFYDLMVAPFGARVEWEPSQHVDSGGPCPPDVETVSRASTVIWYTDGEQSTLRRLFPPYFQEYNALAGYMRIGGNLVLCGFKALEQIMYADYPIEIAAGDTSEPATFVRDVLRVSRVDNSGSRANKNEPWRYGYCFYGAVPSDPGLFAPMYIDSLGKWSVVYDSPSPNYNKGGLPDVEKLEAYQGTALEIFEIDSYLNYEFEGETCALLYLSGTDRGNVCYLGFPLYYLQTPQVQTFFNELLPLFGEERR